MKQMGKKQHILLIVSCILMTWFTHTTLILAEGENSTNEQTSTIIENPSKFKDFRQPSSSVDLKAIEREQFIQNIRNELKVYQNDLFDLNINIQDTEERLSDTQNRVSTLAGQISNLEQQIYSWDTQLWRSLSIRWNYLLLSNRYQDLQTAVLSAHYHSLNQVLFAYS